MPKVHASVPQSALNCDFLPKKQSLVAATNLSSLHRTKLVYVDRVLDFDNLLIWKLPTKGALALIVAIQGVFPLEEAQFWSLSKMVS